jgi:eukaryotic-like serine/threonine-protein kinase
MGALKSLVTSRQLNSNRGYYSSKLFIFSSCLLAGATRMNASDDSDLLERLNTDLAGSYEIVRELESGGMSRVFLAQDKALSRNVVIKVLSPHLAADISTERFAREVKLASSLQQANIVPVFSSGVAAGIPFYVMPFVEGESLRKLMHRDKQVSTGDAIGILKDLARALCYAHERHVVHRDIKPENVLLSGGAAVVTDFGIAKAFSESVLSGRDESLTFTGHAVGTPAYMSPEQASGDVIDVRSDVYSWGVTAYELLAGKHPFSEEASSAAMIRAHIAERPINIARHRADLPESLSSIVMNCLEKSPNDRPRSGIDLYGLLTAMEAPAIDRGRRLRHAMSIGIGVAIVAGLWMMSPRADAVMSLAVLPFVNVGGDPSQQYFSDGVSIEIADALGRIAELRLASHASSAAIGTKQDIDATSIAKTLNVGFLVEGQVLRKGDRLSVSTQLTDGRTGKVLWHNNYDRDAAAVFAIRDDIARSIASVLSLSVPSTRHAGAGTNSVAAHDFYMRGLAAHEGFYTEASLMKAMALYDSAISLDPGYADPYVRLAWAWQNLADDYRPPKETNPRVEALARRAIALDSLNAMAEMSLVLGKWLSGKKFTIEHATRSVRLAPNDATVLAFAGWAVSPFDWRLGKQWTDRSRKLEPTNQFARGFSAWAYAMNGESEAALRLAGVAEFSDPSFAPNHLSGGESLIALGRHSEALREFTIYAKRTKDQGRSGMARALAGLGKRDSALSIVRQLERESAKRYVSKDYIAAAYVALAMNEVALDWLERAEKDQANYLKWLATAPMWKPLHGNPRYEAMIRRLSLVT